MFRESTAASLRQGTPFLGRFAPAGSDNEVPGALTWSDDDGARLQLLGPVKGWPRELSAEAFDIHGHSYAGDDVTIPGAWINQRSLLPDEPKSAISASLIVGEDTTAAERWPRASFTTHNLYPWRVYAVRQLACDALEDDPDADLLALVDPIVEWIAAAVAGASDVSVPSLRNA